MDIAHLPELSSQDIQCKAATKFSLQQMDIHKATFQRALACMQRAYARRGTTRVPTQTTEYLLIIRFSLHTVSPTGVTEADKTKKASNRPDFRWYV